MIDFQSRGSSLTASNARSRKSQAAQNLASANDQNIRLKDSGGFSINVCHRGNLAMEHRLSQNMQGLISCGELQDGVLKNMGDLVARMTEIAALLTNSIQSKEDRAAYQKEFLNLVNQLDSIQGNPSTRDTCFKEGLAESIRGGGSRINTHPQSGSTIASLAVEDTAGKSWGESSEEHASSFLTISCLHKKIIEAGLSDGIKHMTIWMRDHSQSRSKNAAIGHTSNDDFLNNFANTTGGNIFVSNLQTSGAFTNNDNGSIAGSEVSSNPADEKTAQSVIPYANGSPQGTYSEDDTNEAPTFSFSASGETSTLAPIPQTSFGDTSSYNLLTNSSTTQTNEYLEVLPQAIAGSRVMVGSNMPVVQNGLDSLPTRTTSLSQFILQIQDPSYSEEVTNMAKASIRLSFSLSMVEQANQSSSSVVTSLLS